AVCKWAGIELSEHEIEEKALILTSMFSDAGSPKKHFLSRSARKKGESWISSIVKGIREKSSNVTEGSPIEVMANYRNFKGELLPVHVATVEILSLLRPTVAVSVYLLFSIHGLETNPSWKTKINRNEE